VAFTLETKRKQRFDFMRCLYDKTEGSEIGLVYIEEVAEEIHLPELETELIALYLVDEGLIRIRMGHIICITHLGIDEVETILAQPDRPTEHFPALQTAPSRPESAPETARDRDRDWDRAREKDSYLSSLSSPPVNKPGDDLAAMELRNICEAIGLDPREFGGEAAPTQSSPVQSSPVQSSAMQSSPAQSSPVQSGPVDMHDSSNDVSDDVRRLIEQVQAAGARGDPFHPNGGEAPREFPTSVSPTRAGSLKLAHRESAHVPASRESDLADILTSLKLRLLKVRLAPDDMAEAEAEITTAVAQLLSPRPKPQIITVSLSTLVSILEKGGEAGLTIDVEMSLSELRAYLSQLSA
jgi:hypothetical protein